MTLDPSLRRRGVLLTALGLLSACGPMPTPQVAVLPEAAGLVTLDPTRQAIQQTSDDFASSQPLAGRPWDAARAISQLEFLVVDLRWNSRWTEFSPLVPMAFEQARPEWRAALGIDPAAEPQAVIDAMTQVRGAYAGRDVAAAAAALHPPLVNPGGAASMARLAALPPLPQTARAARMAQTELWRMNRNSVDWSVD